MKVYIVIDTYSDNNISFATLRKDVAEDVVNAFPNQSLKIQECELIGLDK